jgi:hypothetical protein
MNATIDAMNRRRLMLSAIPVMLVMIGGGGIATYLMQPRTVITRENAAKIQPGMTLAEVEATFGGPARNEATERVSYCLTGIKGFDPSVPRPPEWVSEEVLVMVYLDANHRVQRCVPVDVRREDSLVEIIRRRLGP